MPRYVQCSLFSQIYRSFRKWYQSSVTEAKLGRLSPAYSALADIDRQINKVDRVPISDTDVSRLVRSHRAARSQVAVASAREETLHGILRRLGIREGLFLKDE